MTISAWYRQKAKQCGRLAKEADTAASRAQHLGLKRDWLDFAATLEAVEAENENIRALVTLPYIALPPYSADAATQRRAARYIAVASRHYQDRSGMMSSFTLHE